MRERMIHRELTRPLSQALSRFGFRTGSIVAGGLGLLLSVAPGCAERGVAADSLPTSSGTIPAKLVTDVQAPTAMLIEENAIRPFKINVSEETLVDLRRRISTTRWPDKETVVDAS